jgi:hypothetical protein
MPDEARAHPFPGNALRRVELDPEETEYGDSPELVTELAEANLVTSEMIGHRGPEAPLTWLEGPNGLTMHRLVIDIDHRVKAVESTTPGHFHLYIDVPMNWHDQALPLLHALADAGVVEPGYVGASERRGYTAVRLPWVRKGVRRRAAVG